MFTIIDRFTRWPEAVPVSDTSTVTLAHVLVDWVARFGVPSIITSDRGSQFTSDLWSQVCQLLGIEICLTTTYHPQANGLVERLHRTMKQALKARLDSPNWSRQLPWVLLGLRSTPKDDLGSSVAELVYGSTLTLPGDFVIPAETGDADESFLRRLRHEVAELRPTPTSRHGTAPSFVPRDLSTAEFVFVRRDGHSGPLQRPYDGPFKVISRGDTSFTLHFGDRGEDVVSIDRLIPCAVDKQNPPRLATPPRRGRPPASTRTLQAPFSTSLPAPATGTRCPAPATSLHPLAVPRRPRGRPRKTPPTTSGLQQEPRRPRGRPRRTPTENSDDDD